MTGFGSLAQSDHTRRKGGIDMDSGFRLRFTERSVGSHQSTSGSATPDFLEGRGHRVDIYVDVGSTRACGSGFSRMLPGPRPHLRSRVSKRQVSVSCQGPEPSHARPHSSLCMRPERTRLTLPQYLSHPSPTGQPYEGVCPVIPIPASRQHQKVIERGL